MKIKITVGDWSLDGHNQFTDFYIESNLTPKEINNFYKQASKDLGFSLIKDCCKDYQDNKLPDNIFKIVQDKFNWYLQILSPEQFLDLYLLIVQSKCPIFEYYIIKEDNDNTLRIGGYGLYDVW